MNFPKRLLLLFLSVHAFPRDHTCVYTTPPGLQNFHKLPWLCPSPKALSPKGPFADFSVMGGGSGLRNGHMGFGRWDLDEEQE